MSASQQMGISFKTVAAGDPNFANVILLAMNDNAADATTTFIDQSSAARTLTTVGNAQYDDATKPSGMTTSGLFDGAGDYLTAASSADFAYGTGDFTWEVFIYATAGLWTTGNFYILDHGSNGGVLFYQLNTIRYYNATTGTLSTLYTDGGAIAASTWTHVAVSRASGTTKLFVGGVEKASASDSHNYGTQTATIAEYGGLGDFEFTGNLACMRVTKGTARYTAGFTPPTLPLPTS